ncbi:MFS transporter [Clostridium sp. YIM B02506]|uniref:MFS transporter n=1 Tax=Clostridium sp. YIM B02506 TaxID=2910680 RepID=UPI001EED6075|nr:MFS transporter [Clostridium sp. YIM B02506]
MEKTIKSTINSSSKIYMLTFISFLVGIAQFVFGGILDKVAESVGVYVSTAGQLTTAFSLAAAIGTPIFMMSTAKMDRRKQLLIALTIIFFGMFFTFSLQGFQFLMLSRVLLGIGGGVYGVCAFSIVASIAPEGRKARSLSNLAMGSSAALVFGVPIGRVIASQYDWRIIFGITSFLTLISIFCVMRLIPTVEGEAPIPLGKQLSILKRIDISMALGVTFLMFVSYSVVNTYITPFMKSVIPSIEESISIVLFALGLASLVGSKLGGFLADRIGAARTLIGGIIVQVISLTIVSLFSTSEMVVVLFLIIWATAAWTCGPMLNYNLVSKAPEASGILLSLNSTFVQLGFAVGAVVGGIVVEGASIMAISWTGMVTVTIAACVGIFSFGFIRLGSSLEKQGS